MGGLGAKSMSQEGRPIGWRAAVVRYGAFAVIAAAGLLWLYPITLLGRMPVGGDVTSFFLPLMDYYRRSLLAGRVPLWNELWGFGFPMLAESQAGVFYPPHLVLYRLFETELAYSLNIVLHTVLAGWFAYFCARQFGLGRWGATLAGLVFMGNGFFIIHFPHQWSYTAGCWLPLAVGLGWRAMRADRASAGPAASGCGVCQRLLAALALALVLAVQMLAGHFQIAFYTQVAVLLMGLLCCLQRVWRAVARLRAQLGGVPARPVGSGQLAAAGSPAWGVVAAPLLAAGAVAVAFLIAAVQILPTRELIRFALPPAGRDYEYLSGFANSPLHLVSYVLPTLFHVNPLWRPVAWDPFHTSPEESFCYVGLLPLAFALAAAWRWRREPRVRLWTALAIVTLLLSLGPYLPGFVLLIKLPGFDGFRAASRWSVATALFLALLAGRAVDRPVSAELVRRWLRGLVLLFVAAGLFSGIFVVGVFQQARTGRSPAFELSMQLWRWLSPWASELEQVPAEVSRPVGGLETLGKLADLGYRVKPGPKDASISPGPAVGGPVRVFTLAGMRNDIMLQELLPPAIALAVIWLLLHWRGWGPSVPRWVLIGLVAADLGAATWLRPTDFMRRGRLVQQSPVLRFLAANASGQRVVDSYKNLVMLAGAAPVLCYRTVDIVVLPSMPRPWAWLYPPSADLLADRFDIRWLVQPGRLWPQGPAPPGAGGQRYRIADPVLARLLHGPGLAEQMMLQVASFEVRRKRHRGCRAWFLPYRSQSLSADRRRAHFWPLSPSPSAGIVNITSLRLPANPATPVTLVRREPCRVVYELEASGPGAVIETATYYPGWSAKLTGANGRRDRPMVERTTSGCRLIEIPAAGRYRLELTYRPATYERGRVITLATLAGWLLAAGLAAGWTGLTLRLRGPCQVLNWPGSKT